MGDLFRRKGSNLSVQARRVGAGAEPISQPDPVLIQVPAGQSAPMFPPPQPGVTQNIIYVVAPQAAGAPATPPQAPAAMPPQEVHYHTTHQTTNNYAPIKRRREQGTSFFGTLAVVAGLLACACAYVPPVANFAKVIAQAGLALGGLGLLSAILFRRAGRGVPVIGIMISAIAFPIWLSKTGQLQGQYDQLRSRSPLRLPAIDFANQPALGPSMPGDRNMTAPSITGGGRTKAATPSDGTPGASKDHSIFGDSGGWQKPDDVVVPSKLQPDNSTTGGSDVPPTAARSTSGNSPWASFSGGSAMPSIALAQAMANLESARLTAARRRGVDYAGVEAAATAATAAYQQAKIRYDLKSPELIDAGQKELATTSLLHEVQATLDNDPDVAAAQQAVRAARR